MTTTGTVRIKLINSWDSPTGIQWPGSEHDVSPEQAKRLCDPAEKGGCGVAIYLDATNATPEARLQIEIARLRDRTLSGIRELLDIFMRNGGAEHERDWMIAQLRRPSSQELEAASLAKREAEEKADRQSEIAAGIERTKKALAETQASMERSREAAEAEQKADNEKRRGRKVAEVPFPGAE